MHIFRNAHPVDRPRARRLAAIPGAGVAGISDANTRQMLRQFAYFSAPVADAGDCALSFDQELRRHPRRDDAGFLIPDAGQTNRADQSRNLLLGDAEFPRLTCESRALGCGADQADKAEVDPAQRSRRDGIVERVRMGHNHDEGTGRRGIDLALGRVGPHCGHVGRHIVRKMTGPGCRSSAPKTEAAKGQERPRGRHGRPRRAVPFCGPRRTAPRTAL